MPRLRKDIRQGCAAPEEIGLISIKSRNILLQIIPSNSIMAPTAPFNPPAADLPGKPSVPAWNPPPVTQEKHDFAELSSIDLSLLDSDDPKVVDALVEQVKRAIRDDGFLFLENYGISLEQVRPTQIAAPRHARPTSNANEYPFYSSTASLP